MDISLTSRQADVLDFIVKESQLKGYPPSVREIGFALGMSSSATVHGHLEKLEAKGYIRKNPSKSRTIEILNNGGLLAKTGKGIPIPIIKNLTNGMNVFHGITEYFIITEQLISCSIEDPLFLIPIQHDELIPLGILKGDYVLVRQQQVVLNGDLIVTVSHNQIPSVNRFFITENGPTLTKNTTHLDGDSFKDIYIFGKVIGVHRKV